MELFRKVMVCVFIFLIAGCSHREFLESKSLTESVWEQSSYQEKIKGFYVDEKASMLLILGEQFSYVINCDDLLCDYAKASREIDINLEIFDLKLVEGGLVKGKLLIKPYSTYPTPHYSDFSDKELINKYIDLNVLETNDKGEIKYQSKGFNFEAKRYEIEGDFPFDVLEKPIVVNIKNVVPDSAIVKAGKISITPVTVIIDGVIFPIKLLSFAPYLLFYKHSI